MREIYLPPFKAAVDAGVATIMSAFNDIAGVPASGNAWLTDWVLHGEWKFNRFVVSDWTSVAELINHGIAGSPSEAGRRALTSGVDMDMQSGIYVDSLAPLVRSGKIPMAVVDSALLRILRAKIRLGLFKDPYRARTAPANTELRALARRAGGESIVLLKNEHNVLPLARTTATIAVIGPLADNKHEPLGPWHTMGRPEDVVTVLQGIRSRATGVQVVYAQGAGIEDTSTAGFAAAVAAGRRRRGEARHRRGPGARRARRQKRRSGEPLVARAPGCAGTIARSRRSDGHAGRAGPHERPAADSRVGIRSRPGDRRIVVPRHRGGECDRRRAVRGRQPERPATRHVPARARPGAAVLQPSSHRPARRREQQVHVEIHRRSRDSAISIRLRALVHDVQLFGTQAQRGASARDRHDHRNGDGEQHGHPGRHGSRAALRSR